MRLNRIESVNRALSKIEERLQKALDEVHQIQEIFGYEENTRRKSNEGKYKFPSYAKGAESRKEMNRVNKAKALEYLGNKCKVCNAEGDFLHFHHRDPKTKSFTISNKYYKPWEDIKIELDKCDLLCANCHKLTHKN